MREHFTRQQYIKDAYKNLEEIYDEVSNVDKPMEPQFENEAPFSFAESSEQFKKQINACAEAYGLDLSEVQPTGIYREINGQELSQEESIALPRYYTVEDLSLVSDSQLLEFLTYITVSSLIGEESLKQFVADLLQITSMERNYKTLQSLHVSNELRQKVAQNPEISLYEIVKMVDKKYGENYLEGFLLGVNAILEEYNKILLSERPQFMINLEKENPRWTEYAINVIHSNNSHNLS